MSYSSARDEKAASRNHRRRLAGPTTCARHPRFAKSRVLQALAEPNDERAAEFVETLRAEESIYPDYGDLLGDPQVDAVVICLPNHLHFPATLAALHAGKHVLCEKPPTLNSAEMRVLQEEAEKRGLVYFFGRQFRFTPAMRLARDLIAREELGTIYFAEAVWVRSRGIPSGLGGWFTEKKRSGGGALIDIGIHALDSAWYLMGTPRPVSVTASVFQNFKHLVQTPIFDVEDAAFAFIRFENGAVVQLKTSWAGNLTDEIPEGTVFGRELNNCTIYGTKATVTAESAHTCFGIRMESWSTSRSSRATTRTLLNCRCKTSWMRSRAERRRQQRPAGGLPDGNARCNLSFKQHRT